MYYLHLLRWLPIDSVEPLFSLFFSLLHLPNQQLINMHASKGAGWVLLLISPCLLLLLSHPCSVMAQGSDSHNDIISIILAAMNNSVNPCDDFYLHRYACLSSHQHLCKHTHNTQRMTRNATQGTQRNAGHATQRRARNEHAGLHNTTQHITRQSNHFLHSLVIIQPKQPTHHSACSHYQPLSPLLLLASSSSLFLFFLFILFNSCGNWIANTTLSPSEDAFFKSISTIENNNQLILQSILETKYNNTLQVWYKSRER